MVQCCQPKPFGKAFQANSDSFKEFLSDQFDSNALHIDSALAFSHTDSKLLTVTVFVEFTPLYRAVQLIL